VKYAFFPRIEQPGIFVALERHNVIWHTGPFFHVFGISQSLSDQNLGKLDAAPRLWCEARHPGISRVKPQIHCLMFSARKSTAGAEAVQAKRLLPVCVWNSLDRLYLLACIYA